MITSRWLYVFIVYFLIFSGVDIGKYMRKIGLPDSLVERVTESTMGHVAVAYALYKIATPARYAVTLGIKLAMHIFF